MPGAGQGQCAHSHTREVKHLPAIIQFDIEVVVTDRNTRPDWLTTFTESEADEYWARGEGLHIGDLPNTDCQLPPC